MDISLISVRMIQLKSFVERILFFLAATLMLLLLILNQDGAFSSLKMRDLFISLLSMKGNISFIFQHLKSMNRMCGLKWKKADTIASGKRLSNFVISGRESFFDDTLFSLHRSSPYLPEREEPDQSKPSKLSTAGHKFVAPSDGKERKARSFPQE
jgi:hypothetical protein